MKFKNLLLGSVTAAGLMTGAAYAADLGVLTSVDVCDQLGISGLTISSDTNCLKISGEVSYSMSWGVWDDSSYSVAAFFVPGGLINWGYQNGDNDAEILSSNVTAKLNFEATADSSFGPAKATLKLLSDYIGNDDANVVVDEAYVSIGEGTILIAGHKGSIFNSGDDEPLNWLGLFNSQAVDSGSGVDSDVDTGGNVIQVTTDIGNGFSLAGGLEGLDDSGSAVGVIGYAGESISAHVSLATDTVFGDDDWDFHAGLAATLDSLKVVIAASANEDDQWNVVGSASAAFDMFVIAGSVEATDDSYTGAGASLTADVSEGVKLNVGGRWSDYGGDESYEIAVGAEASVAENLTLSGAVGYVSEEYYDDTTLTYAWAKLAWAPGGGFTASIKGSVTSIIEDEYNYSEGLGYKIETEFKKTFE